MGQNNDMKVHAHKISAGKMSGLCCMLGLIIQEHIIEDQLNHAMRKNNSSHICASNLLDNNSFSKFSRLYLVSKSHN